MNKQFIFSILIIIGLISVSCSGNDPDNQNGNETNYWETNALVRLQLKGKVKSVKTIYEQNVNYSQINFNEAGQIATETYTYESQENTTTYNYNSSGQLVGLGDAEYTYDTHGKYIPFTPFHVNETGLVPNLKAMIQQEGSRTDYVFNGDQLQIIYTYTNYENETEKDTSFFTYSGKYPVEFREVIDNWGEFMKASYAENGMFKVYEEGFFGTGEYVYTDTRKFTYKTDDEYLLIDQEEQTYDADGTEYDYKYITTYTYNDKKDIIKTETVDKTETVTETVEYTYEYDSQNNWTKRTEKYTYGENVNESEITREITYFSEKE
ncbi:MAG: hypothetical protein PHH37_12325 [Paludibacter sp.]|nr:hypothetical protein [Paludibacter sp.]